MSALISEVYKQQNEQLHIQGSYGICGHLYADNILELSKTLGTRDILDYGCGNRLLENALGFPIHNYDPCIPGLADTPEPADIVVCTEVLEHVEPECIEAVLDDLARLTKMYGYFAIPTNAARKTLADGRNAHLIQQPAEWWFPKLYQRFNDVQIHRILVRPGKSVRFTALATNN